MRSFTDRGSNCRPDHPNHRIHLYTLLIHTLKLMAKALRRPGLRVHIVGKSSG